MTMSHGCLSDAVKHFDAKWGCTTIKMAKQHSIKFPKTGYLYIDEMYGDCTAATLYTYELSHVDFLKWLPAIIEFLSMNGRISAMFTRKTITSEVENVAKDLQKFPIVGMHIQRSNRDDGNAIYYQLTGILKVPNPFVRQRYWQHTEDMAKVKHNHTDTTEFDKLNADFGFTI